MASRCWSSADHLKCTIVSYDMALSSLGGVAVSGRYLLNSSVSGQPPDIPHVPKLPRTATEGPETSSLAAVCSKDLLRLTRKI